MYSFLFVRDWQDEARLDLKVRGFWQFVQENNSLTKGVSTPATSFTCRSPSL